MSDPALDGAGGGPEDPRDEASDDVPAARANRRVTGVEKSPAMIRSGASPTISSGDPWLIAMPASRPGWMKRMASWARYVTEAIRALGTSCRTRRSVHSFIDITRMGRGGAAAAGKGASAAHNIRLQSTRRSIGQNPFRRPMTAVRPGLRAVYCSW